MSIINPGLKPRVIISKALPLPAGRPYGAGYTSFPISKDFTPNFSRLGTTLLKLKHILNSKFLIPTLSTHHSTLITLPTLATLAVLSKKAKLFISIHRCSSVVHFLIAGGFHLYFDFDYCAGFGTGLASITPGFGKPHLGLFKV